MALLLERPRQRLHRPLNAMGICQLYIFMRKSHSTKCDPTVAWLQGY
jgi:hypothetical protein